MAPTITLRSGTHMPELGFGTWHLQEGEEAREAVSEALSAGYRLIDTAKIYGNETSVGQAIKSSGLNRDELFVTTKLWNDDQGYDSALKAVDESLLKLGLDYLDLYLIHWPSKDKKLQQHSWRALEEMHKSGRARAIGVSNYMVEHLSEMQGYAKIMPDVNQIEFHPFIYEKHQPVLDFCSKHKIALQAYSPLAKGDRLNEPAIEQIVRDHDKTGAQVLLRWAIQHGTIPIPKSTNQRRIKENFDVFDFELSESEMQSLDELSDNTSVMV